MDKQTFEQLFRENYSLLCTYACRFVTDKQIAEDIVQNFFIALWEKRHLSVTTDNFLPYGYRSVKNGCINYIKLEIIMDDFYSTLTSEWREQVEENEDFPHKKEIRDALQKLPEKCRKVFLLKCVRGLKYKEIAEVSGISVNTVKYHLGEAFRILREELKHLSFLFLLFF